MNVSCLTGVRKGLWSAEEDRKLRECVEKYGEGKWHKVPHRAGLKRCRKSCRLRWLNYLSPNIKRGDFSADEVDLILRLHNLLGNRWSLIAGRLPGRTANDVKNYWNIHLKKKTTYPEEARSKAEKKVREFEIIKPQPHTFSKEFPWLKTKTNKIMGYNLPKMDSVIQKQPPPTATMPPPRVAPLPPPGDRNKDGYVQDQVAWWHDMLWEMEIEMENEKTRWSFSEPNSGNSISTPGIEVAEGSSFQDTQRRDWVDNIIEENLNI